MIPRIQASCNQAEARGDGARLAPTSTAGPQGSVSSVPTGAKVRPTGRPGKLLSMLSDTPLVSLLIGIDSTEKDFTWAGPELPGALPTWERYWANRNSAAPRSRSLEC